MKETSVDMIVAIAAAAVFLVAAWGDLRRRRIPNALPLVLAGLGLVRMTLQGDPVAAAYTLAAGAAVLLAGFVLFSYGLAGGGDAKLLAGAALLVGSHELPAFLLLMSLCGGVLALAIIAYAKLRPWLSVLALAALGHERFGSWCGRRPRFARMLAVAAVGPQANGDLQVAVPGSAQGGGTLARGGSRMTVPYGVAIAAAGIAILSLQLSAWR
jgi:Flp pilus assembly protein protease CpaA